MMSKTKSVKIGEISKLINGHAFKPKDWTGCGLPIVRIQNLKDGTKPYNYSDKRVPDKHLIDSGDVLLSWSGTPGTSFGCFIWDRGKALLNQHIFKVLVDNSRMDDSFFMYAVNSKLDEMISKAHGGVGLTHITKNKLDGGVQHLGFFGVKLGADDGSKQLFSTVHFSKSPWRCSDSNNLGIG